MIHLIEIDKIHVDSAITVEMYPIENDMIYVFLLDHDYIPTITKFEHAAIFSLKDSYEGGSPNTSAVWNSDGEFFEWFVENDAVENRTIVSRQTSLVDGRPVVSRNGNWIHSRKMEPTTSIDTTIMTLWALLSRKNGPVRVRR